MFRRGPPCRPARTCEAQSAASMVSRYMGRGALSERDRSKSTSEGGDQETHAPVSEHFGRLMKRVGGQLLCRYRSRLSAKQKQNDARIFMYPCSSSKSSSRLLTRAVGCREHNRECMQQNVGGRCCRVSRRGDAHGLRIFAKPRCGKSDRSIPALSPWCAAGTTVRHATPDFQSRLQISRRWHAQVRMR